MVLSKLLIYYVHGKPLNNTSSQHVNYQCTMKTIRVVLVKMKGRVSSTALRVKLRPQSQGSTFDHNTN